MLKRTNQKCKADRICKALEAHFRAPFHISYLKRTSAAQDHSTVSLILRKKQRNVLISPLNIAQGMPAKR